MHLYGKKGGPGLRRIGFMAVFLCAACLFLFASVHMDETAKREQTELLRDAINQAVVSCYAIEGRYPESLDYLIENYGIRVDTEKYAVSYEIFADNIRPGVRVIRLGE